ncbi:MAG: hypothetical protein K2Q97_20070 [Burkholderiaceae bacterium]|nr:hypothetical protein [Burkholderiaceae bacterium]
MQPTTLLTAIALLTATLSTPLLAGDRDHPAATQQPSPQRNAADRLALGMRAVENEAPASTPAYGWRYFTDPAGRRAVVISPQGDYYFSRGKGLHWVAAEQF